MRPWRRHKALHPVCLPVCLSVCSSQINSFSDKIDKKIANVTYSSRAGFEAWSDRGQRFSVATVHRPVASFLTTVSRFPQILDLLKIGVPNGCLGEISTFKIIMMTLIHYLWSKLESSW